MAKNKVIPLFVALVTFASWTCSGCGKAHPPSPPPPEAPSEEDNTPELTPLSPNIAYASGWSEVIINANSAKTVVGVGGHFNTDRNACGKDAYGSIHTEDWNNLAKNVNLAMKNGLIHDFDYCVAIPDDDIYLNRTGLTVDVKTERGTKLIMEVRDNKVCSNLIDHAAADALLNGVKGIIVTADKEECPNGWGS